MSLLYKDEHLSCVHYQNESPAIRSYSLKGKETLSGSSTDESVLCFVKKGNLVLNINECTKQQIKSEEFFLIPASSKYDFEVLNDTEFLIVVFKVQVNLCENYSMSQLYNYREGDDNSDFLVIPFNKQLSAYIHLMDYYLDDKIYCNKFQKLKKEELFVLLRAYYPKEVLTKLFAPILDKEDLFFKNLILTNSLVARNVQELASMANYSTSGFIKKFTRCFGESPYKWMSDHKANRVLYDINGSGKALKEICGEYNFSSMSHFISFCKKKYGQSPGQMRKSRKEKAEKEV